MGNCCEPGHAPQTTKKDRRKEESRRASLKISAVTIDTDPSRWMAEMPLHSSSSGDEQERKQQTSRREKTNSFLQEAKTKLRFTQRKFETYYRLIDILMQGTCADIFEVEHKVTKDVRVAKKINTSAAKAKKLVDNEIAILQELDHPNILKIHEYFLDGDHTILITDYIRGGNLLQAIVEEELEFSEREVAHIMRQIFSGLRYLHQRDILHCDIKPENILFEERDEQYYIKLIDFGVARDLATYEEQDVAGTHGYMSPEHTLGMPEMKSDIWSAGVVFYVLLTGELPFEDEDGNPRQLDCTTSAFKHVSREAVALLEWILSQDSWKRPNAQEVLHDEWFSLWKSEMDETARQSAQQSLNKLKNFTKRNELLKAVMLYLAMRVEAEDTNLRALFDLADQNNNGSISKSELIEAYVKLGLSSESASKSAQEIFNQVDISKKGFIDYTQYLAANLDNEELLDEPRLKSCYDSLDSGSKGCVCKEDILRFAFPHDEDWQLRQPAWLAESKQEISFKQFEQMVRSSLGEEPSVIEGGEVLWSQ